MHVLFPLTIAAFLALPAFAASDDDDAPPTKTETTTTCEDNQIFDEKTKTCMDSDEQSLDDDQRYRAARELAYMGHFDRALGVIDAADDPKSSRFLTYRGFIHRQLAQMDRAMAFYTAALRADPDNILARSYMGIGLVQMGHRSAAKAQLAEISLRGGTSTWAFTALRDAIDGKPAATY